jgi:hypothetical protein
MVRYPLYDNITHLPCGDVLPKANARAIYRLTVLLGKVLSNGLFALDLVHNSEDIG